MDNAEPGIGRAARIESSPRYVLGVDEHFHWVLDHRREGLFFFTPDVDETFHLRTQLLDMACGILNGWAPPAASHASSGGPASPRFRLTRCKIYDDWWGDPDAVFLEDTRPPMCDYSVALLTAPLIHDEFTNRKVVRCVEAVAAALNACDYAYQACTEEERFLKIQLPSPDWAVPEELRLLRQAA